MTDKELLEQAAKAVGIDWPQNISAFQMQYEGIRPWNPLTDDGDALRLAVKLEMHLDLTIAMQESASVSANDSDVIVGDGDNFSGRPKDPYAATRRAIVRAATEIGRTK